jgi:hypothetical protein
LFWCLMPTLNAISLTLTPTINSSLFEF